MIGAYVILAFFAVYNIYSIIKAIRSKKLLELIGTIFTIPIFVFFFSGLKFGGTPSKDAASSYEFYEQGHYYLVNHGHYTEVSYNVFLYMQIIEIIGFVSVAIVIILSIIFYMKNKSTTKKEEIPTIEKPY